MNGLGAAGVVRGGTVVVVTTVVVVALGAALGGDALPSFGFILQDRTERALQSRVSAC